MRIGDSMSREMRAAVDAYLAKGSVLIVDSSPTGRQSVCLAMSELGVKGNRIFTANSFTEALALIEEHSPIVVFSDYQLGNRNGLELAPLMKAKRPPLDHPLFILVTGTATESAVAEASEGDVDAYIVKPYTVEILKNRLVMAITKNANPNAYVLAIDEGKTAIASGEYSEAEKIFLRAIDSVEAPSLACYYLGMVQEKQDRDDDARSSYEAGIRYHPNHYRCSSALFDLHLRRSELEDAYRVIKSVSEAYPLSPQRLAQAIELAVRTRKFEDIPHYHEEFMKIDERRPQLVRTVAAALAVAGRHRLMQHDRAGGLELLHKAAVTSAGNRAVVFELLRILCEYREIEVAEKVFQRLASDDQETALAQVFDCWIYDLKDPSPLDSAARAQTLLLKGVVDPILFDIVIRRFRQVDRPEKATEWLDRAKIVYPDHFKK